MKRSRTVLLAACMSISFSDTARAADKSWNPLVPFGNWNIGANWLPTFIPDGASDALYIHFNDLLSSHDVLYDGSFSSSLALSIRNNGTGTAALLKSMANTLAVGTLNLGGSGNGAVVQSLGTVTVGAQVLLGESAGGKGTYNLQGGTLAVDRMSVGIVGAGSFTQTGGAHRATNLYLGSLSGGAGTYQLSGSGDLYITTYTAIGAAGTGSFLQTGGTNFLGLSLDVGANSSGVGTYDLSGSAMLLAGQQTVGNSGLGNFIQRATSHNGISTDLSVGSGSTGRGTYSLSENAALFVAQSVYVGRSGFGTFIQSGGSHTIGNGLYVGRNLSGHGIYTLSGSASLTVDGAGEFIGYGGAGTFVQSGGTHTVSSKLYLAYNSASTGTYSITAGTLNIGTGLFVGGDDIFTGGPATFIVSGGAVSTAATRVWSLGRIDYTAGSFDAGTLALSSGGRLILSPGGNKTLRATALTIDAGSGSKLDLADNDAVVNYTGDSPLTTVRGLLQTGYNNSNWLGNGVTSTTAQFTANTALGYAEATALSLGAGSFNGVTLDSTSLIIKYTYYGDANLDGKVDVADLQRLVASWQSQTGVWTGGDFDYDGYVGITDLYLLSKNWQAGVGNPPSPALAPILTSLGLPSVEIPEPLSLMGIPALLACSLKRPRRCAAKSLSLLR